MTEHSERHFFEPKHGHGLAHDPFSAIIAPRPIGWISSMGMDGILNLAPYSFFNLFNYRPPIIGFSSIGAKDSLKNIQQRGVFTWSLATRELAQAMNCTACAVPADVDEFVLAGLAAATSRLIDVPWVAQSPVAFECCVSQIIRLKTAEGKDIDSWLVLGEVVGVHIAQSSIVDGAYDTTACVPICRGGGTGDYFTVSADKRFHMPRP